MYTQISFPFAAVLLQASSTATDTLSQEPSFWSQVGDILMGLLILGVFIGATVHMIIQYRKKYYREHSVDEFKLARINSGRPEQSTEEENQLAWDYLEDIFEHWTPIDEESKAPTRNIHLEKSLESIEKAASLAPTDKEVVNRMNELGEVININAARHFDGSKLLVGLGVIFAIIILYSTKASTESYFSAFLDTWVIWAGIGFYILGSFAPQFLIDKRLRKLGSYNASSGIVGFFAGLFLAAPTYDTITKWSNGSKTTSTSFNFLGLMLMLIGLLFMAFIIPLIGLLNYLRNYIFYF